MWCLRPDGTYYTLSKGLMDGETVIGAVGATLFLDPRELGSESLKTAAEEMLSATSGQVTYEFDNGTKTAVYMTSPLTQWRLAIATSDVSAE